MGVTVTMFTINHKVTLNVDSAIGGLKGELVSLDVISRTEDGLVVYNHWAGQASAMEKHIKRLKQENIKHLSKAFGALFEDELNHEDELRRQHDEEL